MITLSNKKPQHQRYVIKNALWRYLIVLRRRNHEEYRCDPVEALKPLLPLGPLPADIHHLEGNLLDDKVVLHDALSRLPGKQNVLLARDVALRKGETNIFFQIY